MYGSRIGNWFFRRHPFAWLLFSMAWGVLSFGWIAAVLWHGSFRFRGNDEFGPWRVISPETSPIVFWLVIVTVMGVALLVVGLGTLNYFRPRQLDK
jgi:hypothetical protein